MLSKLFSVKNIEINSLLWTDFISSHPDATIFHHPAWIEVLKDSYGYQPSLFAVLDNNGRIVAGLPMMRVRSLFKNQRIVSLPFSDFCPPLAVSEESFERLIKELKLWMLKKKIQHANIHWPLPKLDNVFTGESNFRHITNLVPDSQSVFRSFRKGVKSSIRQAEKAGITIKQGETWDDLHKFYVMHLQTRQRLGTPVQPIRFFKILWERLLSQGLGFVLLAHKDTQLVAGAIFLHWNDVLVYKYSASVSDFWKLRPNNMFLWHAIRWGCENGYQKFDWGKTDLEHKGLQKFKRGWGCDEVVLNYSVISENPPHSSNKKYAQKILEKVIKVSPSWVCRGIGEVIYKYAA